MMITSFLGEPIRSGKPSRLEIVLKNFWNERVLINEYSEEHSTAKQLISGNLNIGMADDSDTVSTIRLIKMKKLRHCNPMYRNMLLTRI